VSWAFQSDVPGVLWPAVPQRGNAVLSILYQLDRTERFPPERLAALQRAQLALLLAHAREHSPFYREHWGGRRELAELPLLERRHLQEHYEGIKTAHLPPGHGRTGETRTSGSTGSPVRVMKSELEQVFWRAFTLREHAWHNRDLGGKLAVIRHGVKGGRSRTWGKATKDLIATGPAAGLNIRTEVGEQLDWLAAEQPRYLLTYPSNVAELARASLERRLRLPSLAEVRTLGELLQPEVRALCREAWGVPLVDFYSADEIGYMALQCPSGEHYHVQSEGVVLEVLDEAGKPCAPGAIGRVVVTGLHNFATPLVRYDIGDYAELGEPCACGRGLPVLTRIIGRKRNTLIAPDGRRYYPIFGMRYQKEAEKVRQFQFVQKARDHIEIRLVVSAPLVPAEEQALDAMVKTKIPAGIRLSFTYPAKLERSAGGKFEDFISAIAV
jgi:phenylacetate-CoA ligase